MISNEATMLLQPFLSMCQYCVEREFRAICDKQDLPESLIKGLQCVILYQRPLKSQKGLIGVSFPFLSASPKMSALLSG